MAGPDDDEASLLDEAFGSVTYDADEVGFVPVGERVVERFLLGVRPPMDPEKSRRRLQRGLRRAAAQRAGDQSAPDRSRV